MDAYRGFGVIDKGDLNGKVLFDDGEHKFIWLGADPDYQRGIVQTMQYLIIDKGQGWLLDPGGTHLFSRVVASASRYIALDRIEGIFFSHQDPDVSSGIALWLGVTRARIHISELWIRFLPHFGIVDTSRVQGIPDKGGSVGLGSGARLAFVPSHFMHSPGCFSLHDERARILFSADVGAAVFPEGAETLFIDDFAAALPYAEGFHKRYIASNAVARRWAEGVGRLNPDMIAPQHGGIYRGPAVKAFLAWLSDLRCGVDLADEIWR
jgi:flavorubredoxin